MGKALYRVHRSKKLSDVVGQEHITTTLQNALDQGKISHAYLFTGPRGVGKTSVARILAHEINKLPYTDEEQHIDIIEIDAASNRRIDEIRDLRDKARLSPLAAPNKVYIIDEVHMLTREAFNALLKTLEEPPEHVVFILATTEAHKLPETIISRTQHYSFKPITNTDAVAHLKSIAKKEKITIDEPALELIAQHGKGSFRDSISLLDQMRSTDSTITSDSVRQHLGVPPEEFIQQIMTAVTTHNASGVVAGLHEAQIAGYQAGVIAHYLSAGTRQLLLDGQISKTEGMQLLHGLLAVDGAIQPYQELELVLLDVSLSDAVIPKPQTTNKPVELSVSVKAPAPKPPVETPSASVIGSADIAAALADGLWDKVLEKLRGAHNTLYGIARMAEVSDKDNTLILSFAFDFHKKRFKESRNQEKLQAIIIEILGEPVEVRCETKPKGSKSTPQPVKSDTLDSITKVFGGGEVLED